MKRIRTDHFSYYFFEIIRVLDNKKTNPLKDFIAHQLIKEGEFCDKKTFLKMMQDSDLEGQNQLINNYYCVRGDKPSQDKYIEESKLIQWYKYYLDYQEDLTDIFNTPVL